MSHAQQDVVVHLLFAFDVGYEIDLERGRGLLPGEAPGLIRRRRTPESMRYRPAPLRVSVDAGGLTLPGDLPQVGPARAELALFDFGAVSLHLQHRIRGTLEELVELGDRLAESAPLVAAARLALAPWVERMRPVVTGFDWSELSEEYVVFEIGEVEPGWLSRSVDQVARLVRLEAERLCVAEVEEATRLHLSYGPGDLIVVDWPAALVADRDGADILQVIEFANVQLLEFRLIDDRLDDRLEAAYRRMRPDRRRGALDWLRDSGAAAALREVRELELEATSVIERVDNALKLIGDQYLSRVYALASTRFHLGGWEQSVRRKLETVGDVFDLLTQQASVRRLEFLEVVVIVLIAMEIVLALVRH
ncbi:MAG: hypothetical protein KatS3mg108_3533 [Isosphaeraceae bacterium]|jgi:hypothetical protein|nr:MAG: hypothetical protein KatS3mg108_3533 [Isosphaeraceae bacterium]